ncbi:MAG: hypothetical protein KDB23_01585 [Planctomycetales bacterium]|nr:hypothetical protein [Planctomycetales bacterium]
MIRKPNTISSPAAAGGWTPARRKLVSALLLWHLLAVLSAPWHAPPPASYLSEQVNKIFAPYQAATFLDHGYRFFAPDPGPSHLVRYELTRDDGTLVQGQLPDPAANRPRLLYHRFFMITETMYNIWMRIEEPPAEAQLTAAQRQAIDESNAATRDLLHQVADGIAQQIMRYETTSRVRLQLVEHLIPLPEQVRAGRPLDDPELYRVLADLGEFEMGTP